MSFARPELLWLVIVAPAFIAVAMYRFAKRRRAAARALGDAALVERLGGRALNSFPTARLGLVGGATLLLSIAATGPQWGLRVVEGATSSRSIVLALDVSKSMLAPDVEPNRLERQRVFVRRLLRELAGDRIGLVVFAGRAYVLSPLTVDHSALHLYLDALDPTIVSQGGSSLAAAITHAAELAQGNDDATTERAVLLVSDGEAHDEQEEVLAIADQIGRTNTRIFAVGIGTPGGANVPEIDPRTNRVEGYKQDESGEIVVSRLNAQLLNDIATRTGGRYFTMGDGDVTSRVLAALAGVERVEQLEGGRKVEARERFAMFIGLALLLLAIDQCIRRFGLTWQRQRLSPATRMAMVALLALSVTASGIGDKERGNRLYRAGKYAEAVTAYQAALQAGDDSPELRYNLGTALVRLGRYEEAEQHLRAALDAVDPELRERTLYNLGNRYLEAARASTQPEEQGPMLRTAIEAYQRALRLAPRDAEAKWNLEMALREEQQQQQNQPSEDEGGEGEQQPQEQPPQGGSGAQNAEDPQDQEQESQNPQASDRSPLTREEADRILSAIEQDERDLTRRNLRRGQRRTPVRKDW
jgi:Ca-activated chloride channel family protein